MNNDNIRLCPHCNNVTPHQLINDGAVQKLYDEIEHGNDETEKIYDEFIYALLKCSTCGDYTLVGGFKIELPQILRDFPVLYPNSKSLDSSVPEKIRKVYEEAAQIRLRAPNAYAGQVRKALEFLCKDQNASGNNLYKQINSLVEKGILPPTFAEMTTLIRLLGNLGVHATEDEVSAWDAMLIDEFFRSIIEYVYVAPSKINRLKLRLEQRDKSEKSEGELE